MERTVYEASSGSKKWFDREKAEEFDEGKNWDGSNNISVATGSQTEHEILYLTRNGTWVKNEWSQWQGSIQTWREISVDEAAQWLMENGHPLPDGFNAEDYEG